jgi:hypothetical protein
MRTPVGGRRLDGAELAPISSAHYACCRVRAHPLAERVVLRFSGHATLSNVTI